MQQNPFGGAPCTGSDTQAFPTQVCGGGWRVSVHFPSCWDGKNLDSPDHKSHVAYPASGTFESGGPCPSTHPVRIPQVMYEVMFDTRQFNNKADWPADGSLPWYWSMGDNTVSLLSVYISFFPIPSLLVGANWCSTPLENQPPLNLIPNISPLSPCYFPCYFLSNPDFPHHIEFDVQRLHFWLDRGMAFTVITYSAGKAMLSRKLWMASVRAIVARHSRDRRINKPLRAPRLGSPVTILAISVSVLIRQMRNASSVDGWC